jgi:hypothetical protein
MKTSIQRKLVISAILFVIATVIYLSVSDGPFQAHAVTVPVQFLFLAGVSYAAWVLTKTRRWPRILVLIGIVALGSAVAICMDSLVIMALRPLHPLYFVTGFAAFLAEAFLFLGAVWLIDRVLDLVKERAHSRQVRGS